MSFESQADMPNEKFSLIEFENTRIKAEKNYIFEQNSEMTFPNYSLTKNNVNSSEQLDFLLKRCISLERLLLFADISSAPHIIHDFKAMAQFYLPQLAKEIEIYRFCPKERAELIDFLNYLHTISHEMEDLLLINQE